MESGRSILSKIFSLVRTTQSDQPENVPGRALLKDQFSCGIQWCYYVIQRPLPPTLKMTNH